MKERYSKDFAIETPDNIKNALVTKLDYVKNNFNYDDPQSYRDFIIFLNEILLNQETDSDILEQVQQIMENIINYEPVDDDNRNLLYCQHTPRFQKSLSYKMFYLTDPDETYIYRDRLTDERNDRRYNNVFRRQHTV